MKVIFYCFVFLVQFMSVSHAEAKKMVFLGDSLTEGLGVSKESAYPFLIDQKIQKISKTPWKVVNSGLSGSTSASAPSRVQWILKMKPDLCLIALGANDGLRGLSVMEMKKNLSEAIQVLKKAKIQVILVGMKMPPNYGLQYTQNFEKSYKELAQLEKIPFYPFLLEGMAGNPQFNQPDGIHPNEEGHKVIAEKLFNFLKAYL